MPWSERTPGTFLATIVHEAATPFGHRDTVAALLGMMRGPARLGRPSPGAFSTYVARGGVGRTGPAGQGSHTGHPPQSASSTAAPPQSRPAPPAVAVPAPGGSGQAGSASDVRTSPEDTGEGPAPPSRSLLSRAPADPVDDASKAYLATSDPQGPAELHPPSRRTPDSVPPAHVVVPQDVEAAHRVPHPAVAIDLPVAEPAAGAAVSTTDLATPPPAQPDRAGQAAPAAASSGEPDPPTPAARTTPRRTASSPVGQVPQMMADQLSPALADWLGGQPTTHEEPFAGSFPPPRRRADLHRQVPDTDQADPSDRDDRPDQRDGGWARIQPTSRPAPAGSALEVIRSATRAAAAHRADSRPEPPPGPRSAGEPHAATRPPTTRALLPGRPVRSARSDSGPVVTTLLTRMSVGRSGLRWLR